MGRTTERILLVVAGLLVGAAAYALLFGPSERERNARKAAEARAREARLAAEEATTGWQDAKRKLAETNLALESSRRDYRELSAKLEQLAARADRMVADRARTEREEAERRAAIGAEIEGIVRGIEDERLRAAAERAARVVPGLTPDQARAIVVNREKIRRRVGELRALREGWDAEKRGAWEGSNECEELATLTDAPELQAVLMSLSEEQADALWTHLRDATRRPR